ncbi:hypothetical protein BPO_0146 [Bergeyella porcorum]|uniref:GmrSD restriction endonucleases N-terminal domain-containing protein n=1 Tax=Bergeyella porcorum TaxID=1735111 RepID=A0AAU0EXX8_9FLAO
MINFVDKKYTNKSMGSNNVELKTVSELLEKIFFIPSYQRGYRWTKQQVEDLLNDIDNFTPEGVSNSTEKTWYCLQPLVVKQKEENVWEVIDGQQRLTTIFLILHYFNQGYTEIRRKKLFELNYETRKNSNDFLLKVHEQSNEKAASNIDYQHIFNAYQVINGWFKEKGNQYNQNEFESKFQQYTKVIWYEVDWTQDGRDIFSRINMGKISLTNAELIKALFLNSSNFKTQNSNDEERIRLKQLEIATEWDNIETALHNEEFWLFINKDEKEKETRIEFLFELLVGKSNDDGDNYFTFREFNKKITDKSEKNISDNWKDVKRYFQTLQNWFDNRELYHKIGFLITMGEDVKNLINLSQKEDKKQFLKTINSKIADRFKNIQIDELEKKDNTKVRMILLMHNIQTMLNNKEENTKFPFNHYKKKTKDNKGWDVEHIHAIATKMPEKREQQEDWLKYAKEILRAKLEIANQTDDSELIDEEKNKLEKFISTTYNPDTFKDLFDNISTYVNNDDVDELSNLVLLDLGTNRSYKNEFFSYKRNKIIEKDKTNTFIPICTKNAFLKYYTPTESIKQMTFWSETDKNEYLKDIKKVLQDYLPTQN